MSIIGSSINAERRATVKIAILTPTFYTFYGLDTVAWRQADALAQQGHKVTIFAFRGNMEPPKIVTLELLGMPQSFLAQRIFYLTFPLNLVKAIKCVPRLKDFDIVYSHNYPMNWLAYLAKRFYGIKYIYYHHLNPSEGYSSFIERAYSKIRLVLERWTIKKADGAISVSRYAQVHLKNLTSLDSKVVYNSIDLERFQKGIDGSKIRAKYNLGNDPVVLCVGRICSPKGFHLLVEALSLVKHSIPNAKLLIVGKLEHPAYANRIRQASGDSVIVVGEILNEEIPYYYATCDIYASAALWESFNLPVAEAEACGKPVVAFNIGAHPEIVKDGETGFLVPARDVNALAEAIVKLLKDDKLRQEMGENAYRMVREKFSWDEFAQRTLEVYEEAIKAWQRGINGDKAR